MANCSRRLQPAEKPQTEACGHKITAIIFGAPRRSKEISHRVHRGHREKKANCQKKPKTQVKLAI
jgi:hypothetical protein